MDKGYVLVVDVIAGQNLVACDDNGKSDPYVVVQAGKQKFKTRILKETLDPVWAVGANSKAESFTFTNKQVGKATELLVKCFDWDRFDSDDRMGQFIIPFKDLADNKIHDEWWKLEPQRRGDKVSGSLHLKVQIRKAVKKSGKHSALWSAVKTTNFVGVNDALRKGSIDWAETGDEDCSLLHLALSPSELNTDAEGILMKLLQSDGSQIGLRDAYGNTPLHDFCKKWKSPSCKDAFDLFIKKGADVNAQNSAGETPLHLVVFNPSLKVLLAELLLSKGAKINQANKEGDTCIHYSMSGGRQDLIKLWVLHKGDFTLIGANKKSALEMVPSPTVASTIRDSEEIVRWLQKIGFERYTANFLEEEIFLFLLCEMEEKALAGFIDSRDDREAIISKAKLWRDAKESGKVMRREETFRRQQDHLKRKNEERQKEEVLRKTLKESVQSKPETAGKAEWWEIDISDLDFTRRLGDGAAGEVFKGHWRGKPVAIKVLKATNEEAVVLEFIREFWIMVYVQTLSPFHHSPDILKMEVCGWDQNRFFGIVVPWLSVQYKCQNSNGAFSSSVIMSMIKPFPALNKRVSEV